ncbi:hypothetical protein HPB52_011962 [Rhipicephalus sanguineus]|uniref:Uncharacterized protein n=1 Tax=Rhipicephalus sanguineus TaxID=34632 RepID=A0A9D4T9N9_RHISA|nr:hypothetical protein HPB52_011962 [Rhipicephalus sanguineus]
MWIEKICSRLLPTRTSGPPLCCHGPWYPCRGPFCGFDTCAILSSIRFMQVSLDASGPTLAYYVPGKYPGLKMPPVPSTNIPVFQKGVKDSSVDEQKQWELPDHESKAVQPTAAQTIPTDPRCTQTVASHRWSGPAFRAYAEVSQPHGTQIQTWRCRTVETDASQPRWSTCNPWADQEAQARQSHDIMVLMVPKSWHPGAQATQASTAEIRAVLSP